MFLKHIILTFVASVSIVGAKTSISIKPSDVLAASVPPVITATVVVVSTDVETSFTTTPSSVTSTDLVTAFESAHASTVSLVSHSDSTLTSFPSSSTSVRLSSTSTGFITAVASASGIGFPSASSSTFPINNGAVGVHKGLIPLILASIGGVLLRAAMEL